METAIDGRIFTKFPRHPNAAMKSQSLASDAIRSVPAQILSFITSIKWRSQPVEAYLVFTGFGCADRTE